MLVWLFLGLASGAEEVRSGTAAEVKWPSKIPVYTKVLMIDGANHVRAAAVTNQDGTLRYVLVAHSQHFGGLIEIAPDCIGADKLSYGEIQARVAKVEAEHMAAVRAAEEKANPGRSQFRQALAAAQANALAEARAQARSLSGQRGTAGCFGST